MSATCMVPFFSPIFSILHVVMAIGFGRYSALVAKTPVTLSFAYGGVHCNAFLLFSLSCLCAHQNTMTWVKWSSCLIAGR